MSLDTIIDKLTPCLIDTSTGKILPTIFSIASSDEIIGLSAKGWDFDWNTDELVKTNIYKLLIKGDTILQGLIAMEVFRGAVYVHLLESAPHNRGANRLHSPAHEYRMEVQEENASKIISKYTMEGDLNVV